VEHVSAWASYHNVAQHARRFSSNSNVATRGEAISKSDHGARRVVTRSEAISKSDHGARRAARGETISKSNHGARRGSSKLHNMGDIKQVNDSADADDGAGYFELLSLEMGSLQSIDDVRATRTSELSPSILVN
jgi:hypothetical protein